MPNTDTSMGDNLKFYFKTSDQRERAIYTSLQISSQNHKQGIYIHLCARVCESVCVCVCVKIVNGILFAMHFTPIMSPCCKLFTNNMHTHTSSCPP